MPKYLTWSFCLREEMVPSLLSKIMFNGVILFLWTDLINMNFVFLGFIESLLMSHQFFTFCALIHGSLKFFRI